MINHHIVNGNDSRCQCLYCGSVVSNKPWESIFHKEKHYKRISCECGKKVDILVDFLGSGHDTWDGTLTWKTKIMKPKKSSISITTLENKVQIMKPIKK